MPGEYSTVRLAYTRFLSMGTQIAEVAPYMPLDTSAIDDAASSGPSADYEFEPGPADILERLLPRYAEARLYAAFLDSAASEHAARQRAMKSATENAEEMIVKLSRVMNRARQDSITTEIMEIVGGAEALGGDTKKVHLLPALTSDDIAGPFGAGAGTKQAMAHSAVAVADLPADDLEDIDGIGPVINRKLHELGITTFAQIAAWTPEDAERIGRDLDFPGRIEREQWIDQARAKHHDKYGN